MTMTFQEELTALREALREACAELNSIGYGEPMYGVFHGGDPRDFTPDHGTSAAGRLNGPLGRTGIKRR